MITLPITEPGAYVVLKPKASGGPDKVIVLAAGVTVELPFGSGPGDALVIVVPSFAGAVTVRPGESPCEVGTSNTICGRGEHVITTCGATTFYFAPAPTSSPCERTRAGEWVGCCAT